MSKVSGLGLSSPGPSYGHKRTASTEKDRDGWATALFRSLTGTSSQPSPAVGNRRAFYRDDSPAYLRSPRLTSTTPQPTALDRISLLRIILRPIFLLSRRGPLLPLILLLCFLLILSGNATESANESGTARSPGRIGRFMASVPRPATFNPYRWAKARSGREEEDLDISDDDGDNFYGSWQKGRQAEQMAFNGNVGGGVVNEKKAALGVPMVISGKATRKDGRALIIEGLKHPIPGLMRRAKKRWDRLKARQSKTFAEAIAEYRKRYGRSPPRGFDQWYAFARANKVQLIDEYDLVERDLHVFRALSPPSLRERVKFMSEKVDFTWGVRVDQGKVVTEGELAHHDRAGGVVDLMERFVHQLPDMLVWYNGHDNARIMIPWEERDRLETLVASGSYDDDGDDTAFTPKLRGPFPHWGVPQTCSPDSELRASDFEFGEASRSWTGMEMPVLPDGSVGTVIDSFKRTLDTCNSPQYRHFHTVTSWVYPHWPTALLPLFTAGVHGNYNAGICFEDIHAIITEQFGLESLHDPTWEERPFDRLVWRGQTSGPYWDQHTPWITSHRSRLHLITHQESGTRSIIVTDKDDIAHSVEVQNYLFNPVIFDVGMVGPAVQCASDGTCDEMNKVFQGYEGRLSMDRANLYKYVLDVDGNSWSGRFRRLMLSNAAVVKATIFAEPWTDWVMPWLHFIPIQIDYSDMHDVLAFFRGGQHGEGSHDNLAREIALEGKKWALEHLRYEDLEAYQYRLLLEYGRLWQLDQTDVDYTGDGTGGEPVWRDVQS